MMIEIRWQEATLTESWYTPPWIPPAEAGELLPAVQVAAGVQTFVGVYVAEAVRRMVELLGWTAEVTSEELAEETTEPVDGIGTELLVERITDETTELVVGIGAGLLVEATAKELEAVYQSSAISVFFASPSHETKIFILTSHMNLGLIEKVEESAGLTYRGKDHLSSCPGELCSVVRPAGHSGRATLEVTSSSNVCGSWSRFGVVDWWRISPGYICAICCLFTVRKHISNSRFTAKRLAGGCTHHLTMQSAMSGIVSMWH
jgi:hypothetical protein